MKFEMRRRNDSNSFEDFILGIHLSRSGQMIKRRGQRTGLLKSIIGPAGAIIPHRMLHGMKRTGQYFAEWKWNSRPVTWWTNEKRRKRGILVPQVGVCWILEWIFSRKDSYSRRPVYRIWRINRWGRAPVPAPSTGWPKLSDIKFDKN